MSVVKPVRTCYQVPGNDNLAVFVKNYEYVVVDYSSNDSIVSGPASLDAFPSLREAGISSIDAVLHYPNDKSRAYLFTGGLYFGVRIDTTGAITVEYGPNPIATTWKSLAQAGFITVDAVTPVPGSPNQAYFFSGSRYVKVNYIPGSSEESIQFGPTETFNEWKTLKEVGFTKLECILPNPTVEKRAYFFSKDEYCQIEYTPGTAQEEFASNAHYVTTYWKSLKAAGFY